MIKIKDTKPNMIKLQKGDKVIERPFIDYQTNKRMWEFRGYKPQENNVKENIVELKPKKTKRKKNVRVNLEKD